MSPRLPVLLLLAILATTPAIAQTDPSPAFSLSSSQIFTTKDSPAIDLVFQQIDGLDFRVYKVKDTAAFFASLEDPHQLGSPEPIVPQEQTWLERIASWKARQRSAVRGFLRRQVSHEYRAARRARLDRETVQRRQTSGYQSFAQVPLLNKSQLVASWREILPRVRDAEARRLPLDLPGAGVYLVEAVAPPHRAYTVVIVSDVGLVTKTAPGTTLLYAANRFTGEPIADCETRLIGDRQQLFTGRTGEDGVVTGAIAEATPENLIAVARCGEETVASDAGAWALRGASRDLLGYIYTDKPIYRPGHTVHLKGILRWRERDAVIPFDVPRVELAIVDPDGKVLLRQDVNVDSFGSISGSFTVPAEAPLGYYSIRVTTDKHSASGSFEVQEYRTPEYEVIVTPATRYVVQGGKVDVGVRARYYFGQPVARGSLTYALYRSPYYSPLRWVDDPEGEPADAGYYAGDQIDEQTVRLDDRGEATLSIDLPVAEDARDYMLRIEARVTDTSGREVSGRGSVIGTYGDFLIASSLDRYIYRPGDSATVRIRAVDYTGAPRANVPLSTALERVRWSGNSRRTESIATGQVTTDAEGRASWTVAIPGDASGGYRIRVTAPSAGRTVQDESALWVSGREGWTDEGDQYLELVADRGSYGPGDTARLLIRGAEMDATVLVTKEARTLAWHRVVRVPRGQAIEVPIDEQDVGDTWVNIAFLANDRLYRAERRLRVPPTSRAVNIGIEAAAPVARPRDPGVFTITTTAADGTPVSAQVSLAVIDEAVFAVKPDTTPDPLRFFHRREYSSVWTQFSREYGFVGYSGTQQLQLTRQRRRPFTLADFKADQEARPHVRKEFPDAIHWVADLVTDANGRVTVTVKYPDALTTWRLTARAVTKDTRVGSAVARTTTTKDLILRLITPRFLTENDAVRLPTVVHNYHQQEKPVTVTIEAQGLAAGTAATTPATATIPPGGEVRHEWAFDANTVGTAKVTATASAPDDGDAVELPIPVLPYGTLQLTGQAGSISGAAEESVEITIPDTANPASRTIEVALAPSLAGSLFGALDYLAAFPYGCTEQTISSFFPNLAVMRTLEQLKIAPVERVRLVGRMSSDGIRRLIDLQHDDGGFGWWRTDENDPFMTAYALWAMAGSLEANVAVDRWRVSAAATATAQLYANYPRAVPALKAWMLYALLRARAAGVEPEDNGAALDVKQEVDALWSARANFTPYARALLTLTLNALEDARAQEAARELAATAVTKGGLSWWPSENDPLLDDWMDTSVEATAFAVQALAPHMPDDPLLERAIRWLMANRDNGVSWMSTKQTAFALMGILDFLRARKEAPAAVTVEVDVNGTTIGSHTFTPESWTQPNPVTLRATAQPGANQVRIRTKTTGAVYWTVTGRYHDTREGLEATGARTLALSRRYFRLAPVQRNGRIVYRESAFDGTLAPGDLLLVRLVAAGSRDWKYLMLEDPLPAGAEAVRDPELYELERPPEWWYGSRREYRDTRVVQFQRDFSNGRYEYVYLLKAVTPGRFRAMPARLSPMYAPDVAATTGPQIVEVTSPAQGQTETAAPAAAGGAR